MISNRTLRGLFSSAWIKIGNDLRNLSLSLKKQEFQFDFYFISFIPFSLELWNPSLLSNLDLFKKSLTTQECINLKKTEMENVTNLAQLILAFSVAYVWIFRFHNVLREFDEFGLNPLIRNIVGASKISLSTLLVVGIWFPTLVFIPSLLMGFLMIAAQYYHFSVKNPLIKHLPSMILLILSAVIAAQSYSY